MFTLLRPEDTIRLVATLSHFCLLRKKKKMHWLFWIKSDCLKSPSLCFFRQWGWRVPTLSVHAIWWWCPPVEGRTLRRVWSLAWISPARIGPSYSHSHLYTIYVFSSECCRLCCKLLFYCVSCSSPCTVGLVLPLWSDTLIHLDGDG